MTENYDDFRDQWIRREWGYDLEEHEGSGPQVRCCDCRQLFREPPEEGFRKLHLPRRWADCLSHPGLLHHAVCP